MNTLNIKQGTKSIFTGKIIHSAQFFPWMEEKRNSFVVLHLKVYK